MMTMKERFWELNTHVCFADEHKIFVKVKEHVTFQ